MTRGHEGDFLIMDGHIWLIDQVTPEDQQTTVTVVDVRSAFDRKLPYIAEGTTIGSWLAEQLENHYRKTPSWPVCTFHMVDKNRFLQLNQVLRQLLMP